MNRYWDQTVQQRAAMTRENVQAFLDVELMEKGVLKVVAPQLQPTEEVKLDKQNYFEIYRRGEYGDTGTGILFKTAAAAQAFIEMAPLWEESKYEYGSSKKYAMPGRELSIHSAQLPSEECVIAMASALKRNKATEEANSKLRSEYNEAVKKVDEATSGVWDDWNECRETAASNERVRRTFAEYLSLCKGDSGIAMDFLRKAFPGPSIEEAEEWFGESFVADVAEDTVAA